MEADSLKAISLNKSGVVVFLSAHWTLCTKFWGAPIYFILLKTFWILTVGTQSAPSFLLEQQSLYVIVEDMKLGQQQNIRGWTEKAGKEKDFSGRKLSTHPTSSLLVSLLPRDHPLHDWDRYLAWGRKDKGISCTCESLFFPITSLNLWQPSIPIFHSGRGVHFGNVWSHMQFKEDLIYRETWKERWPSCKWPNTCALVCNISSQGHKELNKV